MSLKNRCSMCGRMFSDSDLYLHIINNNHRVKLCVTCEGYINYFNALEVDTEDSRKWIKQGVDILNKNPSHDEELDKYIRNLKKRLLTVQQAEQIEKDLDLKAKNLKESGLITPGFSFEGLKIVRYLRNVSGETALGTGFIAELSADLADLTGRRSNILSEKITIAKDQSMEIAARMAVDVGGNAIIGLDFDYIVLARNMIGVIANGQAVVVETE